MPCLAMPCNDENALVLRSATAYALQNVIL